MSKAVEMNAAAISGISDSGVGGLRQRVSIENAYELALQEKHKKSYGRACRHLDAVLLFR